MNKNHIKSIVFALLTGLVIWSSPSEKQFLNRLKKDYGTIHGQPMSVEVLRKVGNSSYKSYVLWSEYEYAFGTIKVHYFGAAFMTFYLGSNAQDVQNNNNQTLSSL